MPCFVDTGSVETPSAEGHGAEGRSEAPFDLTRPPNN